MGRHRAGALTLCIGAVALGWVACSSDEEEAKPPARDAAADVDTSPAEDAADKPPVDAARPPFSCARLDAAAVVFCDDFEGTSISPYGFDSVVIAGDGGGTVALAGGGIAPSKKVLDVALVQNGRDAGDAGESAFVSTNLPAGKAPNSFLHYEVEMDFRVVGNGSLAYAVLSVLKFPSGAIKEHGFAVYDGNVFGRLAPKDFAVRDDESLWHHARIMLDRPEGSTTSSFAVTIDIDGTLVDNVGGVDPGSTGTSSIRVGAFATSPAATGTLRAQFDNVVIRRW